MHLQSDNRCTLLTHSSREQSRVGVIKRFELDPVYQDLRVERRDPRGSIGRGVRGFKLVMVSAVSASSWRFRGRGARARMTFQHLTSPTQRLKRSGHERGAVREGIKRPRVGTVEVSAEVSGGSICIGGLGHQMQLQSFSGPTTDDVPVRASQKFKLSVSSLVQLASGSNEPGEGGRGRSKISGSVRQCNFRWWPRRSGLQVGDFEAAGRGHGLCFSHNVKSSVTRAVHLASGSSDPGRSSGQRVQRCQ